MLKYRHLVAVFAVAALAACGTESDDSATPATDSGSSSGATDSGSSSGGTADSGATGGDAGASSSSGGSADAGSTATDAGSSGASTDAGSSGGAVDAGSSSGGGDAGSSGAAIPKWSELKGKEKSDFMTNHVLPGMSAILKKADGKKYPKIMCTHCHGADGFKNGWKMPSGIKPLDPMKMPPKGKYPVADAMYNEVMPMMIKLLGKKPLDPKTGKGFSCFSCHGKK